MPNVFLIFIYSSLLILSFAGCQTTLPSESTISYPTNIQALPLDNSIAIESMAPIDEAVIETPLPQAQSIFENNQISVHKKLLEPNQVGAEILYEIQIQVLQDLAHLSITESLPENLSLAKTQPIATRSGQQLNWDFHDLKAGTKESILIRLRPELEGNYTLPTQVRLAETIDLNLFAGQPDLKIQISGPASVELNTSDTWELILSNEGSAVANEVQLNVLFASGFDALSNTRFEETTLDVGDTKSYTIEAQALKGGVYENQFSAKYKHSTPQREAFASLSTKVVQSNIQIQKTGPKTAYVFKPETYNIQIFNTGDTDLTNIRITDLFADTYSVIDSGNGRVNGNAIGWLIPYLPAGSKQVIQTTMAASKPGTAAIKTLLKTANGLEAQDQVSTQWLAVPGVTISIIDGKDPITIGEKLEYSIQVKNQGEFEPVSGTISIEFSEHLKPTAILSETEGSISGNSITIPNVLLKPEKDILIQVSAQGLKAGSARANLNFIADFLIDPVISQESTNIY